MANRSQIVGLLFLGISLFPPLYLNGIDIQTNQAEISFPETITFTLEATSEIDIVSAEIVYESDRITCGDPVTRAIPDDFTPGKSIALTWELVLRRTVSLPPGAQVSWHWLLETSDGAIFETPKQTLEFIDKTYPWEKQESDNLELYWYFGADAFADDLLQAGEETLDYLAQITGVQIDEKIKIFIYQSSDEMQASTLFAPDWSGGLAYSDHRIVIAAVPPDSGTWGYEVVSHELTHVLIGYYTYSCVSGLPNWLSEGLATYAEGSVGVSHAYEDHVVTEAIETDSLFTVERLGEIFSNDPDLARQAYAQSYSLVEFLITTYGQEEMLELLTQFKEGASEDKALRTVYGLDHVKLDAAWRQWIGAPPLGDAELVVATPTRTQFPTLMPLTGAIGMPTTTSEPANQITSYTPQPPAPGKGDTSQVQDNLFLWLIIGCGGLSLLIIVFIVFLVQNKAESPKN